MKFKAYPGGDPLPSERTTDQLRQAVPLVTPAPGLAMPAPVERIWADAQPVVDTESVERFCRVWAEVGRAILARRSKLRNEQQRR